MARVAKKQREEGVDYLEGVGRFDPAVGFSQLMRTKAMSFDWDKAFVGELYERLFDERMPVLSNKVPRNRVLRRASLRLVMTKNPVRAKEFLKFLQNNPGFIQRGLGFYMLMSGTIAERTSSVEGGLPKPLFRKEIWRGYTRRAKPQNSRIQMPDGRVLKA